MQIETETLPLTKVDFFQKQYTNNAHKHRVSIDTVLKFFIFMKSWLKFDPCFLLIICKEYVLFWDKL